jgi:glycosyltransferase involved in cell wall biosynthesis
MPVHNSAEYLRESVQSILEQSFTNFEFLIADDGSTDATRHILAEFDDPRIRVLTSEENVGVPATLNALLDAAKGKFLARMDADDISLPERLRIQTEFMESHPDVGVCGMWCIGFGAQHARNFFPPHTDADLRFEMFFDNVIPHPSVMMRSDVLRDHALRYDPSFRGAEDYELWARAAEFTRFAVIQEPGLKYRFHGSQATQARMEDQSSHAALARVKFAHRLVPHATVDELDIHRRITSRRPKADPQWLRDAARWVETLADANTRRNQYDDERLRARLGRLLFDNAMMIAPRTKGTWTVVRKHPLVAKSEIDATEWIRFGVRCGAYYARAGA